MGRRLEVKIKAHNKLFSLSLCLKIVSNMNDTGCCLDVTVNVFRFVNCGKVNYWPSRLGLLKRQASFANSSKAPKVHAYRPRVQLHGK